MRVVSSSTHAALLVFMIATVALGGAVGAYIGVNRARAPLNAPEPAEIRERRQRFKQAHIGHARAAVILVGVCWLACAGLLTAASV